MEDAELVKKMLTELGNKKDYDNTKASDSGKLIEDINEIRIGSLREAIKEISEQIELRESLHNTMMEDLRKLKASINEMMPQFRNPEIEFSKGVTDLKKKLIETDESIVEEKLNCFRDIALLKKEMREVITEYREKENRASLLDNLISE